MAKFQQPRGMKCKAWKVGPKGKKRCARFK